MTQTLPLDWSAIEWSDTPPTVPGWYAAKDLDGPTVVRLLHDGGVRMLSSTRTYRAERMSWGPLIAPLAEKQR